MKNNTNTKCPFAVGDTVRFVPSKRTLGLYVNIDRFGISSGEIGIINCISDGSYIYFDKGRGGWHWREFELVNREA